MINPKNKLALLVVYTIGATTTGCGFVLTASSAWMMGTHWAPAAVTFCLFLVPLKAALDNYRLLKLQLACHGRSASADGNETSS